MSRDIDKEFSIIKDYEEKITEKGSMPISLIYDQNFETAEWSCRLPFLKFKEGWLVKIVPPMSGAVVRFKVTTKELQKYEECVSIYFDAYIRLGYMDRPYWEIFPNSETTEDDERDIARFLLGDEESMIIEIESSLNRLMELGRNGKLVSWSEREKRMRKSMESLKDEK